MPKLSKLGWEEVASSSRNDVSMVMREEKGWCRELHFSGGLRIEFWPFGRCSVMAIACCRMTNSR